MSFRIRTDSELSLYLLYVRVIKILKSMRVCVSIPYFVSIRPSRDDSTWYAETLCIVGLQHWNQYISSLFLRG